MSETENEKLRRAVTRIVCSPVQHRAVRLACWLAVVQTGPESEQPPRWYYGSDPMRDRAMEALGLTQRTLERAVADLREYGLCNSDRILLNNRVFLPDGDGLGGS